MARRWLPLALLLVLTSLVGACGRRVVSPADGQAARDGAKQRLAEARARAERQRLEERCLRERPELEARMGELRRAEGRLARLKEEAYVPLPSPDPWDEAAESRFRLEDREVDWQRHQQEAEAWRQREESRRSRWRADHAERLRQAQDHLDRQARALRGRRADLFTGPDSIEFNSRVADQIRQCRPVGSRSVGKTAPPPTVRASSKSVTVSLHSL